MTEVEAELRAALSRANHLIGEAADEAKRLQDERDAALVDAARYRTIRTILIPHMIHTLQDWAADPLAPYRELDETVDHAIAMEAERARMEAGHA